MVNLFKQTLNTPTINHPTHPSQPNMATSMADSYDMTFIRQGYAPVSFVPLFIILAIGSIIAMQATNNTIRFAAIGVMVFFLLYYAYKALILNPKRRINHIQNTPIPPQLWQNDSLKSLNLSTEQKRLVANGLKDFFLIHALYPKRPLAMPSTLVDKLWHAFILDTQRYEAYCKKALGKIFHHIPDYQFKDKNHNIQMFTWQSACRVQGLLPAQATTIPRLFAVDMLLGTAVVSGASEIPWQTYLSQMTAQYRDWHAQVFNNSSTCNGANSDNNSQANSQANNQCDVGITSAGDCSCGGSGDSSGGSCGGGGDSGGGCGGGCGGGD